MDAGAAVLVFATWSERVGWGPVARMNLVTRMCVARAVRPVQGSGTNGLGFTGANRDAMKQGSGETVKQRFASGATLS